MGPSYDERVTADPGIGPEVLAAAQALAAYRGMRDKKQSWPLMREEHRIQLITEAMVALGAAARARISRDQYAISNLQPSSGAAAQSSGRAPEEA